VSKDISESNIKTEILPVADEHVKHTKEWEVSKVKDPLDSVKAVNI